MKSPGAGLVLSAASGRRRSIDEELLAVRSFARYRHGCGCLAVAAFGSKRTGRAGFDAGLTLDLMP